jgi:hypothetical protein
MFEEPAPVVPTWRLYWVTCEPVVQEKVTVELVSILPGVGDDIVAGAAAPVSVYV